VILLGGGIILNSSFVLSTPLRNEKSPFAWLLPTALCFSDIVRRLTGSVQPPQWSFVRFHKLRNSVLPVTRLTAAVGKRDDEHEVGLDGIEDAVREDSGETATNVLVEKATAQRVFEDDFDGVFDRDDEAQIQTG